MHFGNFPNIVLIIVILFSVHLNALVRIYYSSTFNFLKLSHFLKVRLNSLRLAFKNRIVIQNHSK